MERLILSDKMTGFSARADTTSGAYQEDFRRNGASGKLLGSDGQTNGLLSTGIASEESVASGTPSSSLEAGFDLAHKFGTNSESSLLLEAESGTAPPPTCPLGPDGETRAVLTVDLGGDDDLIHGGRETADAAIQAPETSSTGPEFGQWGGGAAEGTRDKDGFAVEDWLEVCELFGTVADP